MEEFEEMEMPTPCQHCGELFDLNDGYGSEKWYPNTTICENCYELEKGEIAMDEDIQEMKDELSQAIDNAKRLVEGLRKTKVDIDPESDLPTLIRKAEMWDKLDEQIGKIYANECESTDEEEGDLLDIGEAAARAFGYL
ncbi:MULTISPECIES: zinc ribbon domain-containing protein [unclassified Chryseobacterium]|uniref:zinc ribbon domain-containing protein n=1 Tax=unclassified Chryseobacterium TaxID=2593645 RepID=UPI00301A94DD